MADWFKFYENGIYESRFQWAIHEESGVCPAWLWILSECCKHKSDHFGWKGQDYELFGAAHVLNITPPRLNQAIELLKRIGYIELDGETIKVLHWNRFQSDYMRKMSKECPDSVRIVSGQTTESVGPEERRGDKKRRDKKRVTTDEEFMLSLRGNAAYQGINIDDQLSKMDSWLLAHPGRQKTRKFIVSWLNRCDKPVASSNGNKPHSIEDHLKAQGVK